MDILQRLLEHLQQELHMTNNSTNPYRWDDEYDYKREGKTEAYEDMIEWVKNEMKESGK